MSSSLQQQQQLLQEKEEEIAVLQRRCASLAQQLQSSLSVNAERNNQKKKRRNNNNANVNNGSSAGGGINGIMNGSNSATQQQQQAPQYHYHPLSPHAINVREVPHASDSTKRVISAQRERIGRTASLATRRVLDSIVQQQQQQYGVFPSSNGGARGIDHVIQRVLDMFQHPTQSMEYLNSKLFAQDVLKLCKAVKHILETEPRVVFIQSPCYVFGDIHGNLEDLHFFSDNIWRLGMSLTAGNFLFLGDYVDRGLNCLETIAYLLAMKQQLPTKVFLLRGNHETRDVNGWEEHYGERSFIYQCRNRFDDDVGYKVWEACNAVFDRLPLAAVIDQDIFCVHGGIPRPVHPPTTTTTMTTTRIQDILTVPKVAGINPPYEHEDDRYQQVASDCIWSDPASEEQEMTSVDPDTGFGESLRGGGAICFGSKAVTDFLSQQDYSYIMRAHEAHADGVAVAKGARVFTVFSTSQDHNQGSHAMAGCMLVDNDKLQVINRSPAYKNQYVHRRDSVSLASLSEQEIQKRMKLGLVTTAPHTPHQSQFHYHDLELEDWQDIPEDGATTHSSTKGGGDSDSSSEDFTIDTKRRPSVDLDTMSMNIHDQDYSSSNDSNSVAAAAAAAAAADAYELSHNKRRRARNNNKASFGSVVDSISEEPSPSKGGGGSSEEEEEIATVDGNDDDDVIVDREEDEDHDMELYRDNNAV